MGLTAFLYSLRLAPGGTATSQSHFQTDLLGRVALVYRLGRPDAGS